MRAQPVGSTRLSDLTPSGLLPSPTSLAALSWVNFLVAMMQTGFGTFIAVNLTLAQWSRTDIGLALGVTGVTGILAQLPGGALVDATARKRLAAGIAILVVGAAAAIIAFWQTVPLVTSALVMQGVASAVLTPALAALALALVPQAMLAARLSLNVRYGALGTALAAAMIGLSGAFLSIRVSLLITAGFGLAAVFALRAINGRDLAEAHKITDHLAVRRPAPDLPWAPRKSIFASRDLLVFAACMVLFQLGNAGIMPLVAGSVIRQHGQSGDAVVAAAVIVSQLLAAAMSLPMGRMADTWGRRAVLLLGLLALPVKAGLFALGGPSDLAVVYQAFDAVSAASMGLIVPLLVADITRKRGHFNLAMGFIGLASGIGGAGGTVLSGVAADWFGVKFAFVTLAVIGLIASALARAMLPGPAPVTVSRS